jgi:hypothetical protein
VQSFHYAIKPTARKFCEVIPGFCFIPRPRQSSREQSEPRQEREFLDRRLRVEITALPRTETGISLSGDEKPRQ